MCLENQQAVKKLKNFAKKTCKDLDFLYNAPHTRRAVVNLQKKQCVVYFCSLTTYQTICVGTC